LVRGGCELVSAGVAEAGSGALRSEVVPLSFRIIDASPRPLVEVIHHDGVQRWTA
jgi:hypothetical protein